MPFDKVEYHKKYYAKNRERILARGKEYKKNNKEKVMMHSKKHYEKNRERLLEYRKQYYAEHGEEVNARRLEKIRNIKKHSDLTYSFLNKRILGCQARGKKIEKNCSLTTEELLELIPKDLKCPVFGTKFSFGKGLNQFSMSIDRIDNNKGYHKDNVVVVSFKANAMKSSATLKELYQVADFYYELEKKVNA